MIRSTLIFLGTYLMLFIATGAGLGAQSFELPENWADQEKDYAEYEGYVLEGIDWILTTPLDQEPEHRKRVNTFLMEWMTNTPDLTLVLELDILRFIQDSDELLMIFMGGYTRYALNAGEDHTLIDANTAGIETVIEFYNLNREELGQIDRIEKYIKLQREGNLRDHIQSVID